MERRPPILQEPDERLGRAGGGWKLRPPRPSRSVMPALDYPWVSACSSTSRNRVASANMMLRLNAGTVSSSFRNAVA